MAPQQKLGRKGFAYTAFDIRYFCTSECLGESGDDPNACRVAEVLPVDLTRPAVQVACTLLYMHQVVADKER